MNNISGDWGYYMFYPKYKLYFTKNWRSLFNYEANRTRLVGFVAYSYKIDITFKLLQPITNDQMILLNLFFKFGDFLD